MKKSDEWFYFNNHAKENGPTSSLKVIRQRSQAYYSKVKIDVDRRLVLSDEAEICESIENPVITETLNQEEEVAADDNIISTRGKQSNFSNEHAEKSASCQQKTLSEQTLLLTGEKVL